MKPQSTTIIYMLKTIFWLPFYADFVLIVMSCFFCEEMREAALSHVKNGLQSKSMIHIFLFENNYIIENFCIFASLMCLTRKDDGLQCLGNQHI